LRDDGADLTRGPIWIADRTPRRRTIGVSPRIGITRAADWLWRFFLAGNPCVSGPRVRRASRGGPEARAGRGATRPKTLRR
jgi:3-methyladenine DNA glycosylase Mpg